jgi:hypothetical protein
MTPLAGSSVKYLCSKKDGGWATDVLYQTDPKGISLLDLQNMIKEK